MERTTVTAPLALAAQPFRLGATDRFAQAQRERLVPANPVDLLFLRAPMVHEGRNANGDIFVREEMSRAADTLIGTALDKDHQLTVDGAVGKFYDAAYSIESGVATIWVAAYINKALDPLLAWKLAEGIVDGISMECLFAQGERTAQGRILRGVEFVGGGLTRMPADDRAWLQKVAPEPLAAKATDRSRLLLLAAALSAAEVAV